MTQKEAKLNEIVDAKQREKLKFIQKLQDDRGKLGTLQDERDEEKKEWIKTSFWAPDNTPLADKAQVKAPARDLYCPAVPQDDQKNAHTLRLKDLISLKLDENDMHEYICWTCQKPLVHQKISCLRSCGHTFCKDCLIQFGYTKKTQAEGHCPKCDALFSKKKDLIDLKESGSAFAAHSNVEATIYKPSF